jgi:hypothetical protein
MCSSHHFVTSLGSESGVNLVKISPEFALPPRGSGWELRIALTLTMPKEQVFSCRPHMPYNNDSLDYVHTKGHLSAFFRCHSPHIQKRTHCSSNSLSHPHCLPLQLPELSALNHTMLNVLHVLRIRFGHASSIEAGVISLLWRTQPRALTSISLSHTLLRYSRASSLLFSASYHQRVASLPVLSLSRAPRGLAAVNSSALSRSALSLLLHPPKPQLLCERFHPSIETQLITQVHFSHHD